jgi:hydrogenase maturation protein HypF
VSAILGIKYEQSFEGEAATALEFKALEYEGEKSFEMEGLIDGDVVATEKIVKRLAEEKLAGTDIRKLAYEFHFLLAKGVAEMAIARAGDLKTAALSGGCYQNKLLTSLTAKILEDNGFKVLLHSMVPPNDGGIALGQALYGMNKINN